MRSQPNRDYISDDVVQTPPALARRLVEHFRPRGRVLEPCKGKGNFLRALRTYAQQKASGEGTPRRRRGRAEIAWCEIKCGRDFYHWTERVDWIITNPPWSQVRRFLQQAMLVSDHVVFVITINHVWTRARVNDIREAGFGLREIVLLDMPGTFPQSGFQLGAVYFARGWKGATRVTDWTRGSLPALKQVGTKLSRTVATFAEPSRASPRAQAGASLSRLRTTRRHKLVEALRAGCAIALVIGRPRSRSGRSPDSGRSKVRG